MTTLQSALSCTISRTALFALLPVFLGAALSCSSSDGAADGTDRCPEIVAQLSACYPDLGAQGQCTAETVALYDSHNVASLGCSALDDMGKADVFAFGGCGEGEHVCGFMFCCDNYVITQQPESADWDIVNLVEDFQAEIPSDVQVEQASTTNADLLHGVSWTWEQSVVEPVGAAPKQMAVHVSQRLIEVPYDEFIRTLRPQHWGIELQYYVGGEVQVFEEDAEGRAIRQIERMVLGPWPCDLDTRLGNNDMTKVEVIDYDTDRAKVYWRVYYSDNDSTEADVGSFEMSAYGDSATLLTFHSAHRLNAPLGIHIANDIVQLVLKNYFLDHIDRYATLVGK